MLARLASYAMVPVLQLSLTVVATESRWRMIQLLTRLLAALDEGGQPIAGHLDALQQWLPTAWTACHGEQLLSNPNPIPNPNPNPIPNQASSYSWRPC